jgi:hypothetical protein
MMFLPFLNKTIGMVTWANMVFFSKYIGYYHIDWGQLGFFMFLNYSKITKLTLKVFI